MTKTHSKFQKDPGKIVGEDAKLWKKLSQKDYVQTA